MKAGWHQRKHTRTKKSGEKFNAGQLKKGIKVEKEHTGTIIKVAKLASHKVKVNINKVAEMIAKDHLREIPDYYTLLTKMERKAGVKD
jgi:hypothetical protein